MKFLIQFFWLSVVSFAVYADDESFASYANMHNFENMEEMQPYVKVLRPNYNPYYQMPSVQQPNASTNVPVEQVQVDPDTISTQSVPKGVSYVKECRMACNQ